MSETEMTPEDAEFVRTETRQHLAKASEMYDWRLTAEQIDAQVEETMVGMGFSPAAPAAEPEAPAPVEPYDVRSGAVPTMEQAALLSLDQKAILDRAMPGWEDKVKLNAEWDAATEKREAQMAAQRERAEHEHLYETDASYRQRHDENRAARSLVERQHTLSARELLDLAGSAGDSLGDVVGELSHYTQDRLVALTAALVPDPARPGSHPGGFPVVGREGLWRFRGPVE